MSRLAGDAHGDRPLRIAHVNDVAFVAGTLVDALRAQGADAVLIDLPRLGARGGRRLRAMTSPLRQAAWLATAPRLRLGGFDLIHVHYAWRALIALPAGRPFVVHCHGTDVRDLPPGSLRASLDRLVLRRAAAVYYATPDLGSLVRAWRPDAAFLPSPIDDSRFAPRGEPDLDVLVAVRAEPGKGVDTIADLLRSILAVRPRTTVTIVAHGAASDRLLRAAGSSARVIAPVPRSAMPDLLRRHRLALGQTSVGAIGNTELEAMASGLPVVAPFRYADAYDVPPPTVWTAATRSTAERAVAILEDEALRRGLGAAGRAWVREHHAAERVAARLLDDYRRLLGPAGDPAPG